MILPCHLEASNGEDNSKKSPIDIPEREQARAKRPPMHSVGPILNAALRAEGTIRVPSHSYVVEPPVAGPRLDVKTPVFEGPLELLLALVEREELDIFEFSLAMVTDSYLIELASREVADPPEMAEFLWMAARLLLIKSIRLLPGEAPSDEESDLLGWEEDVRQRLEE